MFIDAARPMGTTAILILMAFSIGLISLLLGIFGEYLGSVCNQDKTRPMRIIDKTLNVTSVRSTSSTILIGDDAATISVFNF